MKEQDILEETWNILVILDACRYDYFKDIHNEYFNGELEKRRSPGSNTGEWLSKTFTNFYDVTYISSNPYINSLGFSLKECNSKYNYDWTATNHFKEIIDTWFTGWNKELGTVPPREVNLAYFKERNKNKIILHYLQPHLPYLSKNSVGTWGHTISRIKNKEIEKNDLLKKVREWIRTKLKSSIGETNYWSLRKALNIDPRTPYEDAYRKQNPDKLKKHYEENLRIVLDSVKQLIRETNKQIVITADHGESFGEENIWGHPRETDIASLRNVPWFVVK